MSIGRSIEGVPVGEVTLDEVVVPATEEVMRLADRCRHHPITGRPRRSDLADRGDDLGVIAHASEVGEPSARHREVQEVRVRVDEAGHDPRAVEIDHSVESIVRRCDHAPVAHADRLDDRAARVGSDAAASEQRPRHQPARSRMRTMPASPSTSTRSPVWMIVVAKPVPHTAGMRYSRDTIAVCESAPPVSHTHPAI